MHFSFCTKLAAGILAGFFSGTLLGVWGLGVQHSRAEDLLNVRDTSADVIPVIFDTDIGGDIDDAFALGILHVMENRGKCKLLAVTIPHFRGNSPDYVSAANRYFGNPSIPIGADPGAGQVAKGHYASQILALKNEDGSARYPISEYVMENPVKLMRKTLAAAKDNSVVLIQVGEATNTAALLDTPADEISPLTGRELAAKKVRLLSIMGGAFGFQDAKYDSHKEHNIVMDLPAARKVAEEWPGEIVFSGYETGEAIRLSVCGLQNDLLKPSSNLLWDSYVSWCKMCGMKKPNHPRPSWDLTSVLFVLRPEAERGYYSLTEKGTVTVLEDGRTRFTPDVNGKHRVFITNHEQQIRVQEAFVNLIGEFHEKR